MSEDSGDNSTSYYKISTPFWNYFTNISESFINFLVLKHYTLMPTKYLILIILQQHNASNYFINDLVACFTVLQPNTISCILNIVTELYKINTI